MTTFHGGDIIFDQTAQPHHFDSMVTPDILVMIAKSDVEEDASQEEDNDRPGGGTREEFKMEMFLAEKPTSHGASEGGARRV